MLTLKISPIILNEVGLCIVKIILLDSITKHCAYRLKWKWLKYYTVLVKANNRIIFKQ